MCAVTQGQAERGLQLWVHETQFICVFIIVLFTLQVNCCKPTFAYPSIYTINE